MAKKDNFQIKSTIAPLLKKRIHKLVFIKYL